MRCQRCGKDISPLRQLTDREFCSPECRKRGPRASASAIRGLDYEDDLFLINSHDPEVKPQSKASNGAMALVVVVILGVMVMARLYLPERAGGPSPLAVAAPTTSPSVGDDARGTTRNTSSNGWIYWLQNHMPGEKPLRVKTDFASSRLTDWIGSGQGWTVKNGAVSPGKLRLWKPTLDARDYELQFRMEIAKKGLGWAYRAQDAQNFYATKLLISRPGEMSGVTLLRYGMMNSQPFAKAEMPLPVILQHGQPYNISVLVDGNRFTTLIDGHVVDEWSDNRLRAGGVGFFADDGEQALINWADFSERKGWLNKWLSATFFVPPGMPLP
jgi:hypothetical protein